MNKKVKILLAFLAFFGAIAYFVMATAFISQKEKEQRCRTFNIKVSDSDERSFVSTTDVKSILLSAQQQLVGQPVRKVNIYKLEELLRSRSMIKDAEVYVDIDGTLNAYVEQRKPILRINTQGGGFYLDENGFVFPLSSSYTEYVPIATGTPPLPFTVGYKGKLPEGKSADFIRKMLTFAQFLQDNDYWNAMVEQINVVGENDVQLITRVGAQVVKLGSLDNFEYKLHKLNIFYSKAMPTVGWNTYKTINLAYSNQVVCK